MADNPYVYECPVFGDFHDPLAVRRRLLIDSGDRINEWVEAQNVEVATVASAQASEQLIPVVRRAFNLPPIDPLTGSGVADEQVILVLNAFTAWLSGKA